MEWGADGEVDVPFDTILNVLAKKRHTPDTTGTFVRSIEIPKVLHAFTGGNVNYDEKVNVEDDSIVVTSKLHSNQAMWSVRYKLAGNSKTAVRTDVSILKHIPSMLHPVVRAVAARRFRSERNEENKIYAQLFS
tara:strand:+ start:149 stop:550 length:402 start_codon:yes stop_codon:yes gene_type:complete